MTALRSLRSLRIRGSRLTIALAAAAMLMVTALAGNARTADAAFSLPSGCWTVNGNGHVGNLCISLNASGTVTGTIYNNAIQGYWDEEDRKITFIRTLGSGASSIQVFTGYFYQTSTGNQAYVLAGSFEAFSGSGGSPERSVFGWYATKL